MTFPCVSSSALESGSNRKDTIFPLKDVGHRSVDQSIGNETVYSARFARPVTVHSFDMQILDSHTCTNHWGFHYYRPLRAREADIGVCVQHKSTMHELNDSFMYQGYDASTQFIQ